MKKILSAILVLAILAVSVFALASCGGGRLSGRYEMGEDIELDLLVAKVDAKAISYIEFSGNRFTMGAEVDANVSEIPDTVKQLIGEDNLDQAINNAIESMLGDVNEATRTGTYEVTEKEDGTLEITLTPDPKEDAEEGENDPWTATFTEGTDDDGKAYIEINGMTYTKN